MKKNITHIILATGLLFIIATWAFEPVTILPFHVCSAMLCYFWFILCIAINIGISAGKTWSPTHALSSCNVGLVFAAMTIGTGAWWGYHAWGSAWVWEPRITGMFLMTLFFASWRLACAIGGSSLVSNRKLTASLIVLGLPSMAFTHIAVKMFGGIHPSELPRTPGADMSLETTVPIIIGMICIGVGLYGVFLQHVKKKDERIAPKGQ